MLGLNGFHAADRECRSWATTRPDHRTPTDEPFNVQLDGEPRRTARPFVSPCTVQTHLAHVYTKLGLAIRVHLMPRSFTELVKCSEPLPVAERSRL